MQCRHKNVGLLNKDLKHSSLHTKHLRLMTTASMFKKLPRHGKVLCSVCQGAVVDGKDDVLLCEGDCDLWFHRGCASIPPCRYKELSNSEEQFICLSCTNTQLKHEIVLLKNELKGMVEIREKCSALESEISSLRNAVNSLKGTKPLSRQHPRSTGQPKRSYASVARTQQAQTRTESAKRTDLGQPPSDADAEGGNRSANSASKVKVNGARRVRNTLPTCTAKAIATTISKLVTTRLDLRVKRKTKNLANNLKTLWWFVLHGSEADLTILERDWDKIQQQTLWSLQNCYMSLTFAVHVLPWQA